MKLHDVRRNFLIWTVVTIICATPSFKIAANENYNIPAMLIGILIVIIGYTYLSSSPFYQNIKSNKIYFNKALKVAFFLKIANSLITIPFGIKSSTFILFAHLIDIYAGMFALFSTQTLLGTKNNQELIKFFPTLLTTLTEALIMSLFILFVAFLIWVVIRIWRLIFKKKSVQENA